ncbi:MAG: hypothetical protein Q4G24_05355 [Paracoccus sp. (in: a-proteobacteria)]|uniref:hypothetical protein n=1 Tax=Paracoccus sp. TaxID=267 RepID=UPI0026DEA842|nr:hypothetical protein [Paracoccus sp. (in: a-proteobacteria)]MDO5620879.1 hypothetical protein [Paracoccus sp. (in: a-proteobacteria)]
MNRNIHDQIEAAYQAIRSGEPLKASEILENTERLMTSAPPDAAQAQTLRSRLERIVALAQASEDGMRRATDRIAEIIAHAHTISSYDATGERHDDMVQPKLSNIF